MTQTFKVVRDKDLQSSWYCLPIGNVSEDILKEIDEKVFSSCLGMQAKITILLPYQGFQGCCYYRFEGEDVNSTPVTSSLHQWAWRSKVLWHLAPNRCSLYLNSGRRARCCQRCPLGWTGSCMPLRLFQKSQRRSPDVTASSWLLLICRLWWPGPLRCCRQALCWSVCNVVFNKIRANISYKILIEHCNALICHLIELFPSVIVYEVTEKASRLLDETNWKAVTSVFQVAIRTGPSKHTESSASSKTLWHYVKDIAAVR